MGSGPDMLAHAGWVLLMVQMIPAEPVLLLPKNECGPALQQCLCFACVDFTLEYPALQLVDFSVKLGSRVQ